MVVSITTLSSFSDELPQDVKTQRAVRPEKIAVYRIIFGSEVQCKIGKIYKKYQEIKNPARQGFDDILSVAD